MDRNFIFFKKNKISFKVIKNGYLCFKYDSLFNDNGIYNIGLHYSHNCLEFIEVWFDSEISNPEDAFFMIEEKLEKYFGVSLKNNFDDCLRSSYRTVDHFIIKHYLKERFGLEEHLIICPKT